MTADDLAGLPEEARRAFRKMDRDAPYGYAVAEEWQTVRAELLRLAQLAADWRTKAAVFESERDVARSMHGQRDEELQCAIVDRERAEAERDALRKRIDESRHVTIGSYPAHGFGYVQMICDPAKGISDKVYALVPLDDAEAAP